MQSPVPTPSPTLWDLIQIGDLKWFGILVFVLWAGRAQEWVYKWVYLREVEQNKQLQARIEMLEKLLEISLSASEQQVGVTREVVTTARPGGGA